MRLSKAPWWMWSLAMGTVFGMFEVVSSLVEGRRVVPALVGGVVGGALFGLLMGPFMSRQSRRNRDVLGSVPDGDRRAVARAALRGPLPTDSQLRRATARYARSVIERNTVARRALSVAIWVSFTVLAIVLAVHERRWWYFVATLFFVGLGVVGEVTQARIRHRLPLLEGDR